jgi:uncharacterized protein (TIGR03067 family)
MRQLVTLLGVILTPTCVAPAADGPRPEETEYKRLDGTWRVVSSEKDGAEQPPDQIPDRLLLTFTAGNFERGGGPRGTVQRLDTTTTPKQVDYRHAGTGKDVRGIYLVEGDVLVECVAPPGADRPKSFTSVKGSGHALTMYKRVKKKTD